MTRHPYKTLGLCLFFICTLASASAQQALTSSQVHEGGVTYIVSDGTSGGFISSGSDGYVIKWTGDGEGKRYQAATCPVLKTAVNPRTGDFATTEKDDFGIYTLTVRDGSDFSRKYTKQFKDAIEAVTFSSKGSLLFVTTSSVGGSYILNAATGNLLKRIDSVPSKISLVQTADSEKTAMFYCESGDIYYFNLQKMELYGTPHWKTEGSLRQTQTFGSGKMNNRFLAGVKNDTVYIVDSQTGKMLCTYKGTSPLLASNDGNAATGLYFTVRSGSKTNLMQFTESSVAARTTGSASVSPRLIASFTEPGTDISALSCLGENSFVLGTGRGQLYLTSGTSGHFTLASLEIPAYGKILDIAAAENSILLLTKDSVYSVDCGTMEPVKVAKTNGANRITPADGTSAVLWSEKSKKDVYLASYSAEAPSAGRYLFTPKGNLNSLRVFGNRIIYVSGGNRVYTFDMNTKRETQVYSGVTVEDSVIADANTIYVAKASTGSKDSSVLSVALQSRETVALKTPGFVSYGLYLDTGKSENLYGMALESVGGSTVTSVFSYSANEKKSRVLFQYNQEDSDSFMQVDYPVIYSNMGKNQVYAYDIETGRVKTYRRTASVPVKMAKAGDTLVFLTADGGLSWYGTDSEDALFRFYMTEDGKLVKAEN